MTYSVYQHWDPLKVCMVGRSYPPEYYNWIKQPHVRSLFERIAIETEEDYQNVCKTLQKFGVQVMRPDLPAFEDIYLDGKYLPPPMCPRDYTVMIGNVFYDLYSWQFQDGYNNIKDPGWPACESWEEFLTLPQHIQIECTQQHQIDKYRNFYGSYSRITDHIRAQGNKVDRPPVGWINGAMTTRIGRDLYFGTWDVGDDLKAHQKFAASEFPDYRTHMVNTGGHSDGVYCPVCPGLIISLNDVPTYADTFPGWEVLYLPNQSWYQVGPFLRLKEKNRGKWWIPGFEDDASVIEVVETWLTDWVGYVEETVFDVNMLIIDPKNVMVFNYNEEVFRAFDRYGITAHVVPFRHRYFWDGGIHCITSDIHREGVMQDYFPERD